jgi:lipoprotein-releasing system ATP-binding protein
MLTAKGIYKKYNALQVLNNVNVNINKGEMVSIVGSSGAGKSTLLHILGTLDKADACSIAINGVMVHELKEKQLAAFRNTQIGFIFQFHHLLPEFTALENVCMPGLIAKKNYTSLKKEAENLLSMLGLSNRLQHKPNELSGGEQQRVAVARALINKPAIVFADEPTGNLDSSNAQEMHKLFAYLAESLQQTFLIVTHNEELANLSNRILHMKDGVLLN